MPWTTKAKFTREGLAVGRHLLRYDQPFDVQFRDRFLIVYRPRAQARRTSPAIDVNFYAGLVLFETLVEQTLVSVQRLDARSRDAELCQPIHSS